MAFSFDYDTTVYKKNSASIIIDSSWVGVKNVDLLSVSVPTPDLGVIDAAMVRIDGANINGFGEIGRLSLTIRDDILQRSSSVNIDSVLFDFALSNVKLISNDETDIPVNVVTTNTTVYTATESIDLGQYLTVFPNPAQDRVIIQTEQLHIQSYEIFDMTGKLILNSIVTPQNNYSIDLSGLPDGIYNLSVKTDEGIANKRVVIVR